MKKLFLIKLGGSLITNKQRPFTARLSLIEKLCQQIHKLREEEGLFLIVGHGGGSFPHYPASKYRTGEGVIGKESLRGIAEVQNAASKLNRIVVEQFIKVGENAVSFSLSSFMTTSNGDVKKVFLDPLVGNLRQNILPVVYGDVVFDDKKGCSIVSTERLINFLALKLRRKVKLATVVYCGNTDGVYDKKGKTIRKMTRTVFERFKGDIGGSAGIDVTGGMLHKVQEALDIAEMGIDTIIINGRRKNELYRCVMGRDLKMATVVTKD